MTFETIKGRFEEIVGASIDDDTAYDLMLAAILSIEEERNWEYLKAWDSSKTASSGDTYLTAKALPTDWRETFKIVLGDKGPEVIQIPFSERMRYQDAANRFYIDVANTNYYLTGARGQSQTINHCYKKTTTAPSTDNKTSSPSFPSRFHIVVPFRMAELYSSSLDDSDDTTFKLSVGQRAAYKAVHNSMIAWDDNLKLSAMEGEEAATEPQEIPVGMM